LSVETAAAKPVSNYLELKRSGGLHSCNMKLGLGQEKKVRLLTWRLLTVNEQRRRSSNGLSEPVAGSKESDNVDAACNRKDFAVCSLEQNGAAGLTSTQFDGH